MPKSMAISRTNSHSFVVSLRALALGRLYSQYMYTSKLLDTVKRHVPQVHCYADDSQLRQYILIAVFTLCLTIFAF